MCGEEECTACNEDGHEECALIKMKNVVKMINKHVNNRKDTINRLSEIDHSFLNKLKQSNLQIIRECSKGLKERPRKVMDDIFEKNNIGNLKGEEVS